VGKYKVGFDHPEYPQGELFEVPPVGLIKNKGFAVTELTEEQVKALEGAFGVTIKSTNEEVTTPLLHPSQAPPKEAEAEPAPSTPVVATPKPSGEGGETT
jgi:hypothetical protein